MKVNGQWVPCASNSSYSYIHILLKLYRCLDYTLKIRMWFGYNPHFNLHLFFRNLNLIDSGIYTKKVHVVSIYVILRLYLCNLTIRGGGHKFSEFACYFILSSEINVYQKWIKVIFSLQN